VSKKRTGAVLPSFLQEEIAMITRDKIKRNEKFLVFIDCD